MEIKYATDLLIFAIDDKKMIIVGNYQKRN